MFPCVFWTVKFPLLSTFPINLILSEFRVYKFGDFISWISYSFSTYNPSTCNFPCSLVRAVFASSTICPFTTSLTLYVAPGITLSLFSWYFVSSKLNFFAILNPILLDSTCVLYFPSSVSKLKYTPWWLYDISLKSNPFGICIV